MGRLAGQSIYEGSEDEDHEGDDVSNVESIVESDEEESDEEQESDEEEESDESYQ